MKEIEHNSQVRRAAIAILNYLRDHPTAKDTVQGIAKFWIGESDEIVTESLTLLIKEGVVEKRGNIYQLAIRDVPLKGHDPIENLIINLKKSI